MSLLSHLRKQDRDYFGRHAGRDGRGSAIDTIYFVLIGVMPLSFAMGKRISREEFQAWLDAPDD